MINSRNSKGKVWLVCRRRGSRQHQSPQRGKTLHLLQRPAATVPSLPLPPPKPRSFLASPPRVTGNTKGCSNSRRRRRPVRRRWADRRRIRRWSAPEVRRARRWRSWRREEGGKRRRRRGDRTCRGKWWWSREVRGEAGEAWRQQRSRSRWGGRGRWIFRGRSGWWRRRRRFRRGLGGCKGSWEAPRWGRPVVSVCFSNLGVCHVDADAGRVPLILRRRWSWRRRERVGVEGTWRSNVSFFLTFLFVW